MKTTLVGIIPVETIPTEIMLKGAILMETMLKGAILMKTILIETILAILIETIWIETT